jgi:hypothetical protein
MWKVTCILLAVVCAVICAPSDISIHEIAEIKEGCEEVNAFSSESEKSYDPNNLNSVH